MQQCLDDSHFVLMYADIYDLFVMLEEKLTITLHIVQSNLNYPDLDYPDLFPWSRSFFFFFLMNITRCDLEKLKQLKVHYSLQT